MEFKVKKLLKEHRKVVEKLLPILKSGDFYLAGGTALFYYLEHRYSIYLDFFTQKNIDLRDFYQNFSPQEIKTISKDTIRAEVNQVNISFFLYPYPLLKSLWAWFNKSGKFRRYTLYESECYYFARK